MHGRSQLVESIVWLIQFLCVKRREERREKMKEKMKEKREDEREI